MSVPVLLAAVIGRRQAEPEAVGEVALVAGWARTLPAVARRSIGPVAHAAVSALVTVAATTADPPLVAVARRAAVVALVAVAAPIARCPFGPVLPTGPCGTSAILRARASGGAIGTRRTGIAPVLGVTPPAPVRVPTAVILAWPTTGRGVPAATASRLAPPAARFAAAAAVVPVPPGGIPTLVTTAGGPATPTALTAVPPGAVAGTIRTALAIGAIRTVGPVLSIRTVRAILTVGPVLSIGAASGGPAAIHVLFPARRPAAVTRAAVAGARPPRAVPVIGSVRIAPAARVVGRGWAPVVACHVYSC